MSDDTAIKIMQSLGLDYNPAINSTLKFQKTVDGLNTELENMKKLAMQSAKDINDAFSSQLGKKSGNNDIANQFKTVKQEAQATATTVGKMAREIKESNLVNMQAQAAYVQQRVSAKGLSDEYGKQATTLREQLSVIQARLQTEGRLSAEETEQTAQLKEQLDILRAQTRAASHDENRLNPPTPYNEHENKASWFTDGAKFYAITKAAKEATDTIKDVEMGMIEISRVMTDTSFVFDDYRDKLFKLGVDYGQTFDNVQSVALRWAQSGYNVADSLTLTETSMLALNTAELDATQATESMIGIMAQWQLQAEDLALVIDKVNLTADTYSITSQDLVDGLLRSSGAAKNMNMTLDETIGLLTVMREASGRTGKEVGNALNSILSYVTRSKSVDDLESLGIQMFTDETESQFRNALDIFKDISTSWGSLSTEIQDGFVKSADEAGLFSEEMANAVGIQEQWNDVQKRDASQSAAGTHRRNYFIGMIERMSNVQGVLNGMMDAEGYSMRENATTMEALEKKHQSLKTSVEALSVAMGDAGLDGALKLIVNSGTKTIEVINKLPKPIKDAVLAATSMILAVKALEYGMRMFGVQIPNLNTALHSLTNGVDGLKLGFMMAKDSVGAFITANAGLLALSAAVGVIVAVTNAIKKQREEQERLIETTKDAIKQHQQDQEEAKKLYDAYKNAEKGTEEFSNAKKALLELMPELLVGYDSEGNAIIATNDKIKEQIELIKIQIEEKRKLLELTAEDDIRDSVEKTNKLLKKREQIEKDISKHTYYRDNPDELGTIEAGTGMSPRAEIIDMKEAQILEGKKELIRADGELRDLNNEIRDSYVALLPPMNDLTDAQRKVADGFIKAAIEKQNYTDGKTFDTQAYIDGFNGAITNTELLTNAQGELDKSQNELHDGFDNGADKLAEYAKAIESIAKEFEDSSDNLDTYYRLLEEVNSKEGLSVQSKRNIISSHQELIPYLHDEQELRRQLISIIENEEETQRKAYASMLAESESFYDTRIKGNSDLVDSLNEYYNTDFNNFKSLADARGQVEVELVSQLSGIWAQYYNAVKIGMGNTDAMLEDMVMKKRPGWEKANEVLGIVHKVGDMENAFNNIALDLGGTNFKGSGSKAKKSSGSSKEKREENKALQESLKLLEHRKRISEETQESIRNELAELQRISSLYVKTDQERMDMAERIYAVEKRLRDRTLQDSTSFISEKKNYNEMSVEDEIAAWTRVRENQINNINAVKQANLELYNLKRKQVQDAYNQEESTIQHLTKLGVLSVEQQIDAYKKLYETKITSLAEEQKRIENLFNLYKSKIKEQQQAVKDAYDERIKQIENETKAKTNAQNDIIAGIEKELELLNHQEQEYDHDKKMADLREQLAYWEVRTSEDARKKVIDLKKQIDEAEHKREVELKKQGLEEQKKIAQDEIKNIEDTAKAEREELESSYKRIETAFDDHSTNIIALAATMSKEAYDEWLNNYIIPLQNALSNSDFGLSDSIFDELDDFVGGLGNNFNGYDGTSNGWGNSSSNNTDGSSQSNPNNARIYNLANSIANLKREYALGNNPDAPSYTKPLYEELSKFSPDASEYLRNNDYIKAADYVKGLPKMHKGGKSLSYGAVEMMPGELTFPPDLSVGLERLFPLLSNLAKSNVRTEHSSFADNRKETKIENLLRVDKIYMEDDVDQRSLARELQRQLTNLV